MRNTVSDLIQESKRSSYKSKIEQGQDDPMCIWRICKDLGASNKTFSDDEYFTIKQGEKSILDETEKAENLNDYFVNIASKLKEPIEQNFSILREHINSKIPENMHFELPDIDEPFVFRFLSALDVSKSTGLDGIGPRLLMLASGAVTKSITYIAKKFHKVIFQRLGNKPLHKEGLNMILIIIARSLFCQPYQNCSRNLFKLNLQTF